MQAHHPLPKAVQLSVPCQCIFRLFPLCGQNFRQSDTKITINEPKLRNQSAEFIDFRLAQRAPESFPAAPVHMQVPWNGAGGTFVCTAVADFDPGAHLTGLTDKKKSGLLLGNPDLLFAACAADCF